MPRMLAKQSLGSIDTQVYAHGGATLRDMFGEDMVGARAAGKAGEAGGGLKMLRSQPWAAVVIQPQTNEMLERYGGVEQFNDSVMQWIKAIRAVKAVPFLFNHWAVCPSDDDCNPKTLHKDTTDMDARWGEIARQTGATVVPVSAAWGRTGYIDNSDWKSDAPLLYTTDSKHPDCAGTCTLRRRQS